MEPLSRAWTIAVICLFFAIAIVSFRAGYVYCRKSNSVTMWGVRYYISTKDCTFIKNSTDEGYYYPTQEAALEAGQSAMQTDKEVGYVVFPETLQVFETIEPKND